MAPVCNNALQLRLSRQILSELDTLGSGEDVKGQS